MPTPAEIHQQVELEREQIRQGLKQLTDNTTKLEEKEYASASVYGVASIEQLLPLVAARIHDTAARAKRGFVGPHFKEIKAFLKDIEPEAAAAIACKVTFDKVFSPKPKSALVQNVTDSIGQAIENECMMRYYERTVPGFAYHQRELLPSIYWYTPKGQGCNHAHASV